MKRIYLSKFGKYYNTHGLMSMLCTEELYPFFPELKAHAETSLHPEVVLMADQEPFEGALRVELLLTSHHGMYMVSITHPNGVTSSHDIFTTLYNKWKEFFGGTEVLYFKVQRVTA